MTKPERKTRGPQPLADALSELIALRGIARIGGDARLAEAWSEAAGPAIAAATKVQALKRGVLNVAVNSSAMLSELSAFHKDSLLETLQDDHPDLNIKDVRFRLNGRMK